MHEKFKAVVMHGYSSEEALAVMRAVKALGIDAEHTAFATTTPTSIGWKLEDLIVHLSEEHEAMLAARESMKKATR